TKTDTPGWVNACVAKPVGALAVHFTVAVLSVTVTLSTVTLQPPVGLLPAVTTTIICLEKSMVSALNCLATVSTTFFCSSAFLALSAGRPDAMASSSAERITLCTGAALVPPPTLAGRHMLVPRTFSSLASGLAVLSSAPAAATNTSAAARRVVLNMRKLLVRQGQRHTPPVIVGAGSHF